MYLVVEPDAKTIEQLSLKQDGSYESIDAPTRLEVTLCGDCVIRVDLESLFAGCSVEVRLAKKHGQKQVKMRR